MSLDNATLNMAYCWIFFGTGKVAYTSTGTPSSPGEDPVSFSPRPLVRLSLLPSLSTMEGVVHPLRDRKLFHPLLTVHYSIHMGGGGANGGFLGVCESTPSPSSQGGGMHTVSVGPSGPTTK